jgi:hypothetical protein
MKRKARNASGFAQGYVAAGQCRRKLWTTDIMRVEAGLKVPVKKAGGSGSRCKASGCFNLICPWYGCLFIAKLTGVAKRRIEPEKQSSRLVDWFGLDAEARKVWRFERPEFVVVSPVFAIPRLMKRPSPDEKRIFMRQKQTQ